MNAKPASSRPMRAENNRVERVETDDERMIPYQISRLDSEIERLGKAIAMLSDKLAPVMGPDNRPPVPCGDNPPDESCAPVCDQLRTLYRRLDRNSLALHDIMARLAC